MKHAKVSELKARLSEFLAGVRAGGSVMVYDRVTPIARLVPLDDDVAGDLEIEEATAPVADLRRIKPVRLRRRVDVDRVLRESRGPR
jgi:prevent-host-death family protein